MIQRMTHPIAAPAIAPVTALLVRPPSEASVASADGAAVWDAGIDVLKASAPELIVEVMVVEDSLEVMV